MQWTPIFREIDPFLYTLTADYTVCFFLERSVEVCGCSKYYMEEQSSIDVRRLLSNLSYNVRVVTMSCQDGCVTLRLSWEDWATGGLTVSPGEQLTEPCPLTGEVQWSGWQVMWSLYFPRPDTLPRRCLRCSVKVRDPPQLLMDIRGHFGSSRMSTVLGNGRKQKTYSCYVLMRFLNLSTFSFPTLILMNW